MLAGPNSAPLSTPDTRTAGTKESEMLAIGSCQTIPGVLALKIYVHTIRSLQLRRRSHFQVIGEHNFATLGLPGGWGCRKPSAKRKATTI